MIRKLSVADSADTSLFGGRVSLKKGKDRFFGELVEVPV